jgi:predicted ThiF/HesA family dinucleotide-utilizing enzyme
MASAHVLVQLKDLIRHYKPVTEGAIDQIPEILLNFSRFLSEG